MSIKIHVVEPLWRLFITYHIVDRIRQQSCELGANCVHTADTKQQLSRVCIGSVYWALVFSSSAGNRSGKTTVDKNCIFMLVPGGG